MHQWISNRGGGGKKDFFIVLKFVLRLIHESCQVYLPIKVL